MGAGLEVGGVRISLEGGEGLEEDEEWEGLGGRSAVSGFGDNREC